MAAFGRVPVRSLADVRRKVNRDTNPGVPADDGKNKTLQQMFDPNWKEPPTAMAQAAQEFKSRITRAVNHTSDKMFRKTTDPPVLRYLAGTRQLGITYRRTEDTGANQLYATADADHAGADDRRSVSG